MREALGSRSAISAGVRMIPAPMELPRDTATPKPTPSTRRSAPLGAGIVRKTMCAQRDYRRPPPKAQQLWLSPPVDFPPMFLTSSKQTKNKVKFANSNGVRIGHVMPHAMAVLHGVIAKDGGLVCDSEPLSCPRCGAVYDLHYSQGDWAEPVAALPIHCERKHLQRTPAAAKYRFQAQICRSH